MWQPLQIQCIQMNSSPSPQWICIAFRKMAPTSHCLTSVALAQVQLSSALWPPITLATIMDGIVLDPWLGLSSFTLGSSKHLLK